MGNPVTNASHDAARYKDDDSLPLKSFPSATASASRGVIGDELLLQNAEYAHRGPRHTMPYAAGRQGGESRIESSSGSRTAQRQPEQQREITPTAPCR